MSDASETRDKPWLRHDIQGLRAVAVLLVVTFHAGLPIPGGFIGVDVFFVISGFVITGLILRQQSSSTGFRMRTFYARRMRRLLPALALMTSVVVVAAIFLESPFGPQRTTALTGIGASFFVANFVIYANTGGYFDAPAELNPLLHTWSLSVEEQFYFVFPAIMVVCLLVDKRFWMSARVVAIFTLGVLGAVSFLASLGLGTGVLRISGIDDGSSWAFYSSVTRAWEFAVGAILALVLARPGFRLGATVGNVLAFAGMATLAAGSFAISESTLFPGTAALVPVAGTAALIAAGTAQDTPYITRALSTPVMIWIGALSYSWYLWHWPVIVFTQQMFPGREFVVTLAGLASLLPAWLAYRFVENPIRRNGRLVGRRAVALITVAILVPAAASLALLFGSQQSWGSPQITSMTDQIAPVPVSFMRGCDNGNALGRQEGFDCTWGSESRGRPVYLIGDSQAAQFAEATIGAAAQLGRPLTIATMGSCPFITTLPGEEPLSAPECEDFVDDSIAWLTSQPPATVAVGMSGNYVTPEYRQVLEERLIRSIRRLQEHGHQVAVFQAIPQFPEWSPFTCTVFDSLADPRGCGVEVSRRAMDERQALALDLIKDVAERTGSRLIDVRSTLEVGDSYATNDENVWIFRDPFHITVNMSSMLTGEVLKGISL